MRLQEILGAPSVGDRLPNGATVLDSVLTQAETYPDGTYRYGYVLAMTDRREFVTWHLAVRPNGEWVTTSGHYHPSVILAVRDYSDRVARGESLVAAGVGRTADLEAQ